MGNVILPEHVENVVEEDIPPTDEMIEFTNAIAQLLHSLTDQRSFDHITNDIEYHITNEIVPSFTQIRADIEGFYVDLQQFNGEEDDEVTLNDGDYPKDTPLSDECVVCFENDRLLITGCRHVVCSECIVKINGKCPVCREPIRKSLIKKR